MVVLNEVWELFSKYPMEPYLFPHHAALSRSFPVKFYLQISTLGIQFIIIYYSEPVTLGGLAGIVDFSEADIATVCREILDGLVYIHSKLGISHGSVDRSNVLLNRKGKIGLGRQDLALDVYERLTIYSKHWRQYAKQQHIEKLEVRCSSRRFHCNLPR